MSGGSCRRKILPLSPKRSVARPPTRRPRRRKDAARVPSSLTGSRAKRLGSPIGRWRSGCASPVARLDRHKGSQMASAKIGTVLLTGATGFLGPYVATALAQAGWRVRAALRQASGDFPGETVMVGPIGAATNWAAALAGVDSVVHLAAQVHRSSAIERAQRHIY